jgi:beta-lactamase class A
VIIPTRRVVLRGGLGVAAALVAGCAGTPPPALTPPSPSPSPSPDPGAALAELERRQGRRIALVALDTGSGRAVRHRADERVLMCSTAKVLIVAAVLRRRLAEPALLERTIRYSRADLLEYTSTAAAMSADLQGLVLGAALDPAGRDLLTGWMLGATTGAQQIRAGLPAGWRVGDKTGSGAQGEDHDVAVAWPPGRAPVVLAVYTTPSDPESTNGRATVAEATRFAVGAL